MKNSEKTKSKSEIRRRKNATQATISEQELRERIAQKAYELYEKRGRTDGCDVEDWLEAERLVLAQLEEQRRSRIKTRQQRSNGSRKNKVAET